MHRRGEGRVGRLFRIHELARRVYFHVILLSHIIAKPTKFAKIRSRENFMPHGTTFDMLDC